MSACSLNRSPPHASGFILATCPPGSSENGARRWPVSESSFGIAFEKSACSESASFGLEIRTPLHVIPYKNDLADIEFDCDRRKAKIFFEKRAGKSVLFVLNGKAVGNARVSDNSHIDRCAILNISSLSEAISMCETIGVAIAQDKKQCWAPCDKNSGGSWACIAHK